MLYRISGKTDTWEWGYSVSIWNQNIEQLKNADVKFIRWSDPNLLKEQRRKVNLSIINH